MVDIRGVAIYRCIKSADELDQLGVFEEDELAAATNETVRDVAETLIANLIGDPGVGDRRRTPDYGSSKSARIHEYSPEAEVERENGLVTRTVLDELRECRDLEQNAQAGQSGT